MMVSARDINRSYSLWAPRSLKLAIWSTNINTNLGV